jgi:hypothetical protein
LTLGQVFIRVLMFSPVNIIPPWLSMLIYRLGMNNRPVGGSSADTWTHLIDVNNIASKNISQHLGLTFL